MNDHEGYYHICTDGLSRKLLFRDRNDYIHGMNDIPACLQLIEGEIICFSLMPNHVHFIVHTSAENAKRFIENYKKRLSGRLMRKYNEPHSLSRLGTLIKAIDSEDYLKTAIAYVLRNPLAANMVCLPNTYRWSSGYLYFRQNDETEDFNRVIVGHPQAYHLRRHGGNLVGIWCHAVDFARAVDARFILRGLRTVSDFEYERTIADTNQLIAGIETVILFTESAYSHVSSTVARDLISYGKDITEFLPPGVRI